ncbi:MAG: CHRD domain-containing protein [Pseudomonadota bacterium]
MAHDRDDNDRGHDRDGCIRVSADLIGYQELPALSTTAHGPFGAVIDRKADTITWKWSDDALEGSVAQSHVHFGQMSANGGISFLLCSNLGNGPQACPPGPAKLTGVITPDLVIGPGPVGTPAASGQDIEAEAFAEIATAIKEGVAYANVHSSKWPGGEVRGQLH